MPSLRTLRALTLMLLFALPSAADAAIEGFTINSISGEGDLSLDDDRFGTRSSATEHKVNYLDCFDYNGESTPVTTSSGGADAVSSDTASGTTTSLPTADFVLFDVSMPAPLGTDWFYAIKVGACDTNGGLADTETDTCRYIRQRTELSSFHSIEFRVNVRHVLGTRDLADDTERTCSSLRGQTGELRVLFLMEQSSDAATRLNHEIVVDYDYDLPEPPTDLEVEAGENNVHLSWVDDRNASESEIRYRAYYSESLFDDAAIGRVRKTDTVAASSMDVSDLEDDTAYYMAVTAIDGFDNESVISEVVTSTPVEVNDFYEEYIAQGGRERGGYCDAGKTGDAGHLWPLLALVFGLVLLRVRRPAVLGVVLVALLGVGLMPSTALAQLHATNRTERHWTTNVRVGTWQPEVDTEFAPEVTKPYATIFGSDSFWTTRVETGYLLTDYIGSLFFTFEVGYGRTTGKGLELDSNLPSGDKTRLTLVPTSLGVLYQMDLLARHFGFPVIPYGRGGVDYAFWWMSDGHGSTSEATGYDGVNGSGSGATHGYHFAGGVRLLLDTFAPNMARGFDADIGVNDSYLFAEIGRTVLDDFASGDSIILSDTLVSFGLGFDY